METIYYILSLMLIAASILPFISNQHWFFRAFDFIRIQVLVLQILVFSTAFFVVENQSTSFFIAQALLFSFIAYSASILIQYTRIYPVKNTSKQPKNSNSISILSVNVYQFNKQYQNLIDLVQETDPDILLTIESNAEWEKALSVLDHKFKHCKKIALENTYGMHFYTKLTVNKIQVNYFVADDIPSLEIEMETYNGKSFVFFGIHPPPPSPTEEKNSKKRDGELLSVAKKVRKYNKPVLVVGDFNNVAWAKSSILFRKTSELIDPRRGRGFISTFHADYKLFRFPIDLIFHSTDIFIKKFKTLRHIGSDHLPLYCQFFINSQSTEQESETIQLEKEEVSEVNEMIRKGKSEKSNRSKIASE